MLAVFVRHFQICKPPVAQAVVDGGKWGGLPPAWFRACKK